MADSGLARALREGRRSRKLSLRDVENLTGVSNAYLSQVEHGKIRKPSPVVLHQLSKVYEIPYEHLLETAGYPVPTAVKSTHSSSAPLQRFANISREEEAALAEYLDFLRAKRRPQNR
jgi:transcriptional regulator with XRE-family HTH domain